MSYSKFDVKKVPVDLPDVIRRAVKAVSARPDQTIFLRETSKVTT